MERVTGIEPVLFAWEAKVLPLNYTRPEPSGDAAIPPVEDCSIPPVRHVPHTGEAVILPSNALLPEAGVPARPAFPALHR